MVYYSAVGLMLLNLFIVPSLYLRFGKSKSERIAATTKIPVRQGENRLTSLPYRFKNLGCGHGDQSGVRRRRSARR